MNFTSSIERVLQQQNSRVGHDVSALSALTSGFYGSSHLSHKHLATLTKDTICTSIEELIYLTRLNVMMVFFTSILIVLILCLPTKLLILLKMECS